jgi:hypothetical protein
MAAVDGDCPAQLATAKACALPVTADPPQFSRTPIMHTPCDATQTLCYAMQMSKLDSAVKHASGGSGQVCFVDSTFHADVDQVGDCTFTVSQRVSE